MKFVNVRTLGCVVALALSPFALAQQQTGGATTGGTTGGGGGTTTPTTPTTPGGSTGGGRSGGQPSTTTTPSRAPEIQRPLFVSGTVVLSDGREPPDRVMIERLCGSGQVRPEGYTDSKGHFSFQLGANQGAFADASTGFVNAGDPTGSQLTSLGLSANTNMSSFPNQETAFWVCELRGKLAGYRSSSVPLAGKRYLDNPDIGRIVLTPMAKTEGLMESATASLAPKDARKAYEKGEEAARKNKPEQAEKELRKAVELYVKHAPAWFELGKLAEARNQFDDARAAYLKALEADSKYVYPYVQMYRLAFQRQQWEEMAKYSNELLRLNPYEFPDAFYYNGVAHFQLKNYKEAETSMREAIKADWRKANVKTHYVLGVILANQNKLEDAADSLHNFLEVAPKDDTAIPTAKEILARIDQARARNQAPAQ